MAQEAVHLITIKGQSVGLDKLRADVQAVSGAQNDLTAASEKSSSAQLSVEKALGRLQSRYDAVYKSQESLARVTKTLDQARDQGLVDENRRAQLLGLASDRINKAASANDNMAKASSQAQAQVHQLGLQLNDVATGLATGQSPFMIMAQQGGQVYQALSGPKGISDGLRNVAGYVRGLITPATVAGTTLVAAATLAFQAWNRLDNLQKEVLRTVQGLGQYLGLSVSQFEALAQRAATAGDITVARATETANALARTGNLDTRNIERIVALSKDFAATFTDGNLDDAQARLVQGFGTGASGLTQMVTQLKLFRGQQLNVFEDLVRQNRLQDAIKMTLDAMNGRLVNYEQTTSKVAGIWERTKNLISDADLALGRMIDKAATAQQELVKKVNVQTFAGAFGGAEPSLGPAASAVPLPPRRAEEFKEAKKSLDDFTESVNRHREAQERAAEPDSALNVRMQENIDLFRKQRDELVVGTDAYNKSLDTVAAWKDVMDRGTDAQKQQLLATKDATEAISIAQQVTDSLTNSDRTRMTAEQRAAEQTRLASDEVRAETVEQQAQLAVRRQVAQQRGQNITQAQAEAEAQAQGNLVRERVTQQMRLMLRDQGYANEALMAERQLLFASTEERARVLAVLQKEQELKRQGIDVSGELARKIISEAGAHAQARAELERTKQVIAELKDIGVSAFTSLAQAIASGVKPLEAMHNSLKQIGNALISGGIKQVAEGNLAVGGIEAAVGFGISLFESDRDAKKAKRQKSIEAFQAQMDAATKAMQDAQEQQIRAAKAAADMAAEAAAEAVRHLEEVTQRQKGFQDRLFEATNDASTLEGQLAAFDRSASQQRLEEARLGGEALGDLEAALYAERSRIVRDFVDQALQEEKRRFDEARQFLDQFARTIKQFVDNLKTGASSPLSPGDRLIRAQQQYAAQLAAAQAGNRDALTGITNYASNYLDAAKAFYASSQNYQNIFDAITTQLSNLPSQVSPEQLIVNQIASQTTTLSGILNSIDTNGDGMISRQEASNTFLNKIFNEVDVNGDGQIDQLELIKFATQSTNTHTGDSASYDQQITLLQQSANAILSTQQTHLAAIQTNTAQEQQMLQALQVIQNATSVTSRNAARTTNNTAGLLNFGEKAGGGITGDFSFATGGWVRGPGTSMSDSIRAHLSNGEFVMRADAAKMYAPLLEHMNRGQPIAMPAMPVNDNGVWTRELLGEVQALRAEVVRLRDDNSRVTVAAAEHVREGVEGVRASQDDMVRETKKRAFS